MDLEATRWFVYIVQQGSFSKAADFLGIPSSTLSRRLAALEEKLGHKLLHRTTRQLALTDDGERFLVQAKALHAQAEELENWFSHQNQTMGTLRITAPNQFVEWPLADWAIRFKQHYPDTQLELLSSNKYLDFFEHRLDFAFRQGPLPDSNLIQRKLFNVQTGIYAAPSWLAQHNGSQNEHWLKQQFVINLGAEGICFPWRIKTAVGEQNIHLTSSLYLETVTQALRAASGGFGPIYVSEVYAEDYIASGALVPIAETLWPSPHEFFLVYRQFNNKPLRYTHWLNFVFEQLRLLGNRQGVTLVE